MNGPLVNTKMMDSSVGSTKIMDRSLEGSVSSDVSGEGTNGINRLTKRISGVKLLSSTDVSINNSGVKPSQMHDSHSKELHVTEYNELYMKNQSSLSTTRLKDLEKGNAQFLLYFLENKQSDDPSFFYAVQIDEKERLTKFFWVDGRSKNDFAYFRDAVLFDNLSDKQSRSAVN
ncbi:protein FAR-RED ELONGATED HYPOCOTYL 3-like isoform X2 [Zingiber officinale]|uniref:protein FAR-RED ELONGATED HYPOCOTYL 3-like isoform X2 n=1 Tax=Zingiber officinale TaxID=94328 RepID=UPI001C4BAD97|nr:protein FAR-RED ELONGATED HYPOCOTYL 3-like isoform X2 [Zingiber officinale]